MPNSNETMAYLWSTLSFSSAQFCNDGIRFGYGVEVKRSFYDLEE